MKVAIDGPAGSGKSTVARALASRCGLTLLDTGAMYRSVTLACLERGVDVRDADAAAKVAREVRIAFGTAADGTQTVALDGKDVTERIRTKEVDANVSAVSAIPAVREAMVAQQRAIGGEGDVVAEGRDIGTVVFPDAEVKVFLTADASARAFRRAVQRSGGDAATDATATVDEEERRSIQAELERRDVADSSREASPLRAAEDAEHIDSSNMTVDEVVSAIERRVRTAREAAAREPEAPTPSAEPEASAVVQAAPAAEPEAPAPEPERSSRKPKTEPAGKSDKKGRLHVFGFNTLDDYYEHPIREFPITSRMLLATAIGVCGVVSKLFWPWKLENGQELWDAAEGMVVVMNHESMIDPVIIVVSGYAHGRRMRPIYKSELDEHRIATWFLARVGAIPVKRGTADIKVIRRAQRALQNGEDVLVFPEGTRVLSDDQEVTVHGGFALMAQLAKAPVLPVAIVGARDGAPGGNKPLRPGKIIMRAGKKLTMDMIEAKGRKRQAKAMESLAMQSVYALRDALRVAYPGKM